MVPRLPDFFGFEGGSSERQCGQSTAAMRTGSPQNGQSLMPLAGITVPTVCLGGNISKPATEAKGRSGRVLAPWHRCLKSLRGGFGRYCLGEHEGRFIT